jgi:predicted transcriptional regulator
MMIIKANGEAKFMPLYEALASEVRWKIMSLIANNEMNVKDIADHLELSPSIVTMHIRKLEQAGLAGSHRVRLSGGTHKMCFLKQKTVEIELPLPSHAAKIREQSIPVGHYTAFEVHPTCGLGTPEKESEYGMTPDISLIPSVFRPPFCGLGGVMLNTKCLTICSQIKPQMPSKYRWSLLRKHLA